MLKYDFVANLRASLSVKKVRKWLTFDKVMGSSLVSCFLTQGVEYLIYFSWGLAAGYQPRPQVVDRGTTTRYGGQLRYKLVSSPDK